MKIALFGRNFNDNFTPVIHNLLTKLFNKHLSIYIYKPFQDFLNQKKDFGFTFDGTYDHYNNFPKDIDFVITIGGDGTFLEAITIIRDSGTPIVGINSGRLGFLANIAIHEAEQAVDYLLTGNYEFESRSLLKFQSDNTGFADFPYALNECTLQKTGSSLTTFRVSINNEFLTAYWADGLIISTPTGSTAYSLSLGGPIVTPQSANFIITPIAAHNLNVRPLVIPDTANLSIAVEGRTDSYSATLDSRSIRCEVTEHIHITKATFSIKMIKLPHINFYSTLRNKLLWGADKRN
jgi:Predicted sugar kinase